MCFGFFGVYVEDIQRHMQGDSYHGLSETGKRDTTRVLAASSVKYCLIEG